MGIEPLGLGRHLQADTAVSIDPHEWTDAWTRHQSRRTLALLMGELDALDQRIRQMEYDRDKLLRDIERAARIVREADKRDDERERLLLRASLISGVIPSKLNGKQ